MARWSSAQPSRPRYARVVREGSIASSRCFGSLPRSSIHLAMSGTTVTATSSDASSEMPTVHANGWKILPMMPLTRPSGTNTATVVSVEDVIAEDTSAVALRIVSAAAFLAALEVSEDVLDDDDGVVDHAADRHREPAEGHHVERDAGAAERRERDQDRERDRDRGDQRRAPVAQEQQDHDRPRRWRRGYLRAACRGSKR